ncbi:MAG: sulfatase-like hydrolase/transferase, partial [Marinomonas sp.]
LGSEAYVVGKSEGRINPESLTRLGIPLDSDVVLNRKDNGFTPWEHFGGLYPDPLYREGIGYNDYLKDKGYTAHNPWESVSNTSTSATGEKSSGWLLRNADKASDIKAEHSETVFLTDRAIQFIESRDGSKPWCLHLSYFKPHWPLIAPTPYNTAYSADDVLPANKHESELQDDHPAYKLFRDFEYSKTYSDDEKRAHIIPTYMGLIEELDDQIGRLLTYLDENNLTENTLIALTSDHGDYLGDHWLGEKDLFHEPSIRVPLIISGPDVPKGKRNSQFVEAIDLVPTFVEAMGGAFHTNRMEGLSLWPLLREEQDIKWRDTVVAEIDYGDRGGYGALGQDPYDARGYMLRNTRWKYVYWEGMRPQLYDLQEDPNEFYDIAQDPKHAQLLIDFERQLFKWVRQRRHRTEPTLEELKERSPELDKKFGILIGHW